MTAQWPSRSRWLTPERFVQSYTLFLAAILLIRWGAAYRTFYYVAVLPLFFLTLDREALRAVVRSRVWLAALALLMTMWASVLFTQFTLTDLAHEGRRCALILSFVTITAYAVKRFPIFLPRLFSALVLSAAAAALLGILTIVVTTGGYAGTMRLAAVGFLNANVTAAVFSVLIFGAAYYAVIRGDRALRPWIVAALAVMGLALLLAQSRGNLVAFTATACVIAAATHRRGLLVGLGLAVGLVLVLAGIELMNPGRIIGTDSKRIESWLHFLSLWEQHPWTGVGLNYDPKFMASDGERVWHAHSIYIAYLAHGGVFALVFLLAMLFAALRVAVAEFRRAGNFGLLGMILFVMLYGVVDFAIFEENASWQWLHFWLPVGIMAGVEAKRLAAAGTREATA